MRFEGIEQKQKTAYNKVVGHPLQAFEWGEFRINTGVGVVRCGGYVQKKLKTGFTLTLHPVPKTPYTIGYLPKGDLPDSVTLEEIFKVGKEHNCVFIQLEPNVIKRVMKAGEEKMSELQDTKEKIQQFEQLVDSSKYKIVPSFHPLFTKYNFVLDISPTEDELLMSFHAKTRYNIRVARDKHEVKVEFDSSKKSFEDYLSLLEQTTSRQGFYAHTPDYHRKLYETLSHEKLKSDLSYHIARARYQDSGGKTHTLAAWVLFAFGDTLYYPYGASSHLYRFTMASNLICWEAIRYGKRLGLKKFDMWGALSTVPDKQDAWYGFHRFKSGYNPSHVEYIGSYDVVVKPSVYKIVKAADKVRWAYLGIRKKIR